MVRQRVLFPHFSCLSPVQYTGVARQIVTLLQVNSADLYVDARRSLTSGCVSSSNAARACFYDDDDFILKLQPFNLTFNEYYKTSFDSCSLPVETGYDYVSAVDAR